MPAPTKSGDDLVDDQEDLAFSTKGRDRFEKAGRRDDDTAGEGDRLDDDGGNRIRPELLDLALQGGAKRGKVARCAPDRIARTGDMPEFRAAIRLGGLQDAGAAGEARQPGRAMVAAVEREDVPLGGLAAVAPMAASDFDRQLVRSSAGCCISQTVAAPDEVAQSPRQVGDRAAAMLGRTVGEPAIAFGGGRYELPIGIAEIDATVTGGRIEQPPT